MNPFPCLVVHLVDSHWVLVPVVASFICLSFRVMHSQMTVTRGVARGVVRGVARGVSRIFYSRANPSGR